MCVLEDTEICMLHNQLLDEHYITQCEITRHLKLCSGCYLSRTVISLKL